MKRNQKYLIAAGAVIVVIIGIIFLTDQKAPKVAYTLPAGEQPFKGRADASVIVDEFADFQCPACAYAVAVVNAIDVKYGNNIRINFKNFPLESIHQNAMKAALSAQCANDQGKFWLMHDAIYEKQQDGLSAANLRKLAESVGLDMAQYDACYDSSARLDVIRADQREGDRLDVNGTPTFVINGKTQVGLKDLEAEVRKALGLPAEAVK